MASQNLALSISNLINITVNLSPSAAQGQNLNSMMILGSTQLTVGSTTVDIIDVVERYRSYASLASVAFDFGTSAPEYLSAVVWFEQFPNSILKIGKWAKTNTPGSLRCGSVPASTLAALQAITAGSFLITLNGTVKTITGLNFSAITALTGAASVIQTALQTALANTICLYNSTFQRFEITSPTTGTGSTVSFMTTAGSGVDVSSILGGQSTNGGYIVPGQAAESAIAAVTLFDDFFGGQWYGLYVIGTSYADIEAIASFTEGTTNKHTYWYTANPANNALDAGAVSSVATTDIGYILNSMGVTKTFVQYSTQNQYAALSAAAKYFSVDYQGQNTVIDLMYKQEPGIIPELLSQTQAANLQAKNYNVFVQYNNNTAIIQYGRNISGTPMDTIIGLDNLAIDLQTAWFNQLYLEPTKLPQTDGGDHVLVTVAEQVLYQFVQDDFLAPGVWSQSGFGSLNKGDFLNKGYYVYANPIATQSVASRAARQTPPIQIAVKLAGAIEVIIATINVDQ